MTKRSVLGLLGLALLAALGLAAAAVARPPAPAVGPPAAAPDAERGGPPADLAADGPGPQAAAAYWRDRYTYPTGRYDPAWLRAAAAQDRRVGAGVPAGRVTYQRRPGPALVTLDPAAFTALGPLPLQTNGSQFGFQFGHVSGRANVVVVNPGNPAIAYLGTAGGGVWKTTTCCGASTTWQLTTDDPVINTTDIASLTLDPNTPTTVYAGTGDLENSLYPDLGGSQGLLKSTDAGSSWTVLGANVFGAGIQPSWTTIYLKQAIGKVQVDPRNSNTIVAGTRNSLYISNDGGTSWSAPCYTNPYTTTQAQVVTGLLLQNAGPSTTIYVALGLEDPTLDGANGVYKATLPDTGCPAPGAWTLLNAGWPSGTGGGTAAPTLPGRIDLAVAPGAPATLYAQVASVSSTAPNRLGGQLGVWKTTDGGTSWTQQSTVTALTNCSGQSGDYPQNGYDQGLAVDPNNPDVLFMATFEIWKSTDGGQTFADLTCAYNGTGPHPVHPDQHGIVFLPGSSSSLLAVNDGGAVYTPDAGGSWSQLNDSLNTVEFYSGDLTANFATAPQAGVAGGAQDNGAMVYTGTVGGPTLWQGILSGDGFFARIDGVTGSATAGTWFLGTNQGLFWRATNGPSSHFTALAVPWRQSPRERAGFALPYEIQKNDCLPAGCTHLIVGTYHVWETTNSGTSWTASSGDLTGGASYINQLSYAGSTSTVAIAGTADGKVQVGFGLGAGTAATWVDVTGNNAVLPNRSIDDVTTDPLNPLIGYAAVGGFDENTPGTPGHLFQLTCTAGCATYTWADKTGNLPDIPLDSVIANPRYPQQVFAGSDWGLYFTNDITASPPVWQRFQAGLPNVVIWDLTIDRGTTTLAAWTRSRGAYVWPLPAGPLTTPTPTPVPPTSTPAPSSTPTATSTAAATQTPSALPTATPCAITFVDVPPSAYFYTPVTYLACHGVISGYGDATFRPYNQTTRGQMVKIIVNGFQVPAYTPPNGNTFADVPPAFPFFTVVEAAGHAGIVSGYACGGPGEPCDDQSRPYFRPYTNVTRGQLAKIIVAAAGWPLVMPPAATFADVAPGSPFYAFVETAYCHSIISGYACGGPGEPCDGGNRPYFRGGNNAVRGQIAKIVYGALTSSGACNGAR
ncbi:MAG TPA: S-layer homology domain-containing protein [Chloroflexia bacterium]|nr:S-layer homology domain-containing protein [Chloroflexia bacterium]